MLLLILSLVRWTYVQFAHSSSLKLVVHAKLTNTIGVSKLIPTNMLQYGIHRVATSFNLTPSILSFS